MKINRNNYETYFIDHLDGRLDASLVMELNQFLEDNPDLKEELDSFETISINLHETFNYSDKEVLKKAVVSPIDKINSENYNEYFIASFEGDLNSVDQKSLKSFIEANPQLQSEYDLFKISRISSDKSIIFANKKSLKKYPFLLFKTWYKPIGIAASIIVLFGIFNILQQTSTFSPPEQKPEVPSEMKRIEASGFRLSYDYPTPASREYQISITHTEEIIPTDPLLAMSPIKVPLKSFIASLSYTVVDIEELAFKNEYEIIAKELMIKEELLLASYGETNPNASEKLEKALWAKSFGKQKSRKSREERIGDENKKARINFWTLASIGIESFNEITGSNVNIERKLNKEGEKNKYILVNGNVSAPEVTDLPDKPSL